MMHSLEVRTPLLDIEVVKLAATIPEQLNIRRVNGHYEGKLLLKKLLGKYFPTAFIHRPKQGFAAPMDHWLDGRSRQSREVYDRLRDTEGPLHVYLQTSEIEKTMHARRKEMIWKLLFLDEWLRQNT